MGQAVDRPCVSQRKAGQNVEITAYVRVGQVQVFEMPQFLEVPQDSVIDGHLAQDETG